MQFGHLPFRTFTVQSAQNVHSNVQIKASLLVGGRSRSQHPQLGRSSSILDSYSTSLAGLSFRSAFYQHPIPQSGDTIRRRIGLHFRGP